MSFNPEDPKWSAYVLGELDEAARRELEAELADSDEARRFVDELRRTIELVSAQLRTEPCPASASSIIPIEPAPVGEALAAANGSQPDSAELQPAGMESVVAEDEADYRPRRPLFRTIKPEGHKRIAIRMPLVALAASVLVIVGLASFILNPGSWHIRDLRIAFFPKPAANELVRNDKSLDHEGLDGTDLRDPAAAGDPSVEFYEDDSPTTAANPSWDIHRGFTVAKPQYETKSSTQLGSSPSGGSVGGETGKVGGPMPAYLGNTSGGATSPQSGTLGEGDAKHGEGRRRRGVDSLSQVEHAPIPEIRDRPMGYPDAETWRDLGERRKGVTPADRKEALGRETQSLMQMHSPRIVIQEEAEDRLGVAHPRRPSPAPGDTDDTVRLNANATGRDGNDAALNGNSVAGRDGDPAQRDAPLYNRIAGPYNPFTEKQKQQAAELEINLRYARATTDVAHLEYLKALEANKKVKGAVPEVEINRLKLVWRQSELAAGKAEVAYSHAQQLAEVDRNAAMNDHAAEAYEPVTDNPFLAVKDNPLSTFSIDVDTASYSIVRRYLLQNHRLPPPSAVRIEELVNYFHYDFPQPEKDQPFATNVEVAGCPWNADHRLVRVGIKGREIARDQRPLSNLVFLVDVSGSMNSPDKLPLVKESLRMLTEQMGENDRVAIAVYAGSSGLVLPSTNGTEKQKILAALDNLQAGGSTNGAQGIELAYQVAEQNFVKGGVNRVILATDGDFNVGVTDRGALVKLIETKAAGGVFLTTLGYGMGNLKDATLEQLADKGNGNYAYIDDVREAKKVLVDQMSGTLVTIAKDVKIQVEFNPAQVAAFRLIGYENRILRHEDFNDDKKDAGEIGAGHTVTALYELVPVGKPVEEAGPGVEPLKYQQKTALTAAAETGELLMLKLRYKQPDGDKSQLIEAPVKDAGQPYARATGDFKFAASVALFGMLLRDSPYKGTASFAAAAELAQEGRGSDLDGYRAEFIELISAARSLVPEQGPAAVEAPGQP